MASQAGHRDLVYCHECQDEWYRDEHGLICPHCQGDFTEIIEADHDPRHDERSDDILAPDPDEDDIAEMGWGLHDSGPGFTYNASSPTGSRPSQSPNAQQPQASPLYQGLASVVGNILGSRMPLDSQHAYTNNQPFGGGNYRMPTSAAFPSQTGQNNPNQNRGTPLSGGYTVRTGGGPNFRWQITTSYGSGQPHTTTGSENFPGTASGPRRTPFGGPYGMQGMQDDHGLFMGPLGPILAGIFNPAMMRGGDAVYSQEALDRIISELMEQNASGNAPGPATNEAIVSLPKRKINEKDLGSEGKADCSICMEEVNIGEEVTELPCHHWFHGECVNAWLSEHDTCPHCRQGIMPKEGEGSSTRVRSPSEAPRHDQMWGQGEGTQQNPWVVPESPQASRSSPQRRPSGPARGSSRRSSGNESLLSRMRSAFGGSGGGS